MRRGAQASVSICGVPGSGKGAPQKGDRCRHTARQESVKVVCNWLTACIFPVCLPCSSHPGSRVDKNLFLCEAAIRLRPAPTFSVGSLKDVYKSTRQRLPLDEWTRDGEQHVQSLQWLPR